MWFLGVLACSEAFLLWDWVFWGMGILSFFAGVIKIKRFRTEKEQLEFRIQESRQQVRETERVFRDIQKKQENLEKKISEFLSLPKRTDISEMERSWKQLRRKAENIWN